MLWTVQTWAVPPDRVLSRHARPRPSADNAFAEPVALPVDVPIVDVLTADGAAVSNGNPGAAEAAALPDNTMTEAAAVAVTTCIIDRFIETNFLC
ncbi:hypothetical protein [Nocardia iowensis]|uniref:Uncharacterized protein n=1 Tax=Nocardia iowensis TaxID=204891 RepID=A0ABX8RN66_NOCIO|nr:hypothetical protein [Nocardia iowensis]QXN91074.1 hypothetical protein KV110_38000 [Nocardia iowensis]